MLICELLHCAPLARCTCIVPLPYDESCCHGTSCMWYACRLLHHNLQEAKRIVASPAPAITRFAEEQSPEQRDHIFDELNTLAVIYRKPSSSFTNAVPAHKEVMTSVCLKLTLWSGTQSVLLCCQIICWLHARLVDRYPISTGICIAWHPNTFCCLPRFVHCCL